jgi:hypothetical protein
MKRRVVRQVSEAELVEPNAEVLTIPNSATAIYVHQFYQELEKRAKLETVQNVEVLIFRGKLSDVFESLSISNKYYSRIRKILLKYDCVQYLERGTRSYDSTLLLNHAPPPIEKFSEEDLTDRTGPDTVTEMARRLAELEQEVAVLGGLRDKLGGIDITEALRNLESRVRSLEQIEGIFPAPTGKV